MIIKLIKHNYYYWYFIYLLIINKIDNVIYTLIFSLYLMAQQDAAINRVKT